MNSVERVISRERNENKQEVANLERRKEKGGEELKQKDRAGKSII